MATGGIPLLNHHLRCPRRFGRYNLARWMLSKISIWWPFSTHLQSIWCVKSSMVSTLVGSGPLVGPMFWFSFPQCKSAVQHINSREILLDSQDVLSSQILKNVRSFLIKRKVISSENLSPKSWFVVDSLNQDRRILDFCHLKKNPEMEIWYSSRKCFWGPDTWRCHLQETSPGQDLVFRSVWSNYNILQYQPRCPWNKVIFSSKKLHFGWVLGPVWRYYNFHQNEFRFPKTNIFTPENWWLEYFLVSFWDLYTLVSGALKLIVSGRVTSCN